MSLYLRGYENFLTDLYVNPDFAHRILRFVTDAAKAYVAWRSEFLNEPIRKGDLFNDDVPIMSPKMYTEFVFPYEQELCDYYGGIYYWHSCGDTTSHIERILRLSDLQLFDIGPAVRDRHLAIGKLKNIQPTEIRFAADELVQKADEAMIDSYLNETVEICEENRIEKYVLRVSGMSVLLGAKQDLEKLKTWIKVARGATQARAGS